MNNQENQSDDQNEPNFINKITNIVNDVSTTISNTIKNTSNVLNTSNISNISNESNISNKLNQSNHITSTDCKNCQYCRQSYTSNNMNYEENIFDPYDTLDQVYYPTSYTNQSNSNIVMKLYVMKKINLKNSPNGFVDDTISIPISESEKILSQDNFMVDVKFNDQIASTKVTSFDAPNRMVMMPEWIMEKIGAKQNDLITLTLSKIKKITRIKVTTSSKIQNCLPILEFYFRDRNVLYVDETIQFNMFENKYIFKIDEIYHNDEKINVGKLYDSNLNTEIIFDLSNN